MGPKRNGNPDQTKVSSKFLTRPNAYETSVHMHRWVQKWSIVLMIQIHLAHFIIHVLQKARYQNMNNKIKLPQLHRAQNGQLCVIFTSQFIYTLFNTWANYLQRGTPPWGVGRGHPSDWCIPFIQHDFMYSNTGYNFVKGAVIISSEFGP